MFARFVVQDTSMQPCLRPGDRVIAVKCLRPRAGDVVVCRDPEYTSQFIAKRVGSTLPNGDLFVVGDNPNVSRDSRSFGAVPRALVVGRVVWRYLPGARRGRV